jgi:hypothetical protein
LIVIRVSLPPLLDPRRDTLRLNLTPRLGCLALASRARLRIELGLRRRRERAVALVLVEIAITFTHRLAELIGIRIDTFRDIVIVTNREQDIVGHVTLTSRASESLDLISVAKSHRSLLMLSAPLTGSAINLRRAQWGRLQELAA